MKVLALFATTSIVGASDKPIVLIHAENHGLTAGAYDACTADAYHGHYLSAPSRQKGGKAVFHFDPPADGCYVMEEWHPGNNDHCNRYLSEAIRVDVAFCRGMTAYDYIDQTKDGGRWNVMGALPFYKGWPGNFTVTNSFRSCREGKDCFWAADSFRVTKVPLSGQRCIAPDSMPNATYNPKPAMQAQLEQPEVVQEKMASATINKEVLTTLIDDALVLAKQAQGSWKVESGKDPQLQCRQQGWKQQFFYMDPVNEDASPLEFPFEPQADGCYLVEEFHPDDVCEKGMSSDVSLTISYCKGRQHTVRIDQTTGGNKWNVIGLLPFYVGHQSGIKVTPSTDGSGITVADSFRFTKVASTCAGARAKLLKYHEVSKRSVVVTVDDQQAAITGTRKTSCDTGALHGSAHASEEDASATFNIVPPSTGCYRVDQFHPKATEHCSLGSADLQIAYCLGGLKQAVVDMAKNAGQWNPVGHYPFYAGEAGSVTSRRLASSTGLWAADGFRFTKVSDSCRQVPEAVLLTMRIVGEGLQLAEPQFFEGHLTKHTDMRLAFHDAMVKATGLGEEFVRVLSLRNGSIIIEYELVGVKSKAAAAALNMGASSQLATDLCAAATVGMEIRPKCKLELTNTVHVESPAPFIEDNNVVQEVGRTNLILIGAIAGAVILLLGVIAGFVIFRMCLPKRKPNVNPQDAIAPEEVVVAKEKVDEEVGDTASTATPQTVDSEVQTEVSGDVVAEQTETFSASGDVTSPI